MKIKTYRARTMQEALRTIKAELGPDAVILSTRQIRQGKFLGLFGRYMIEVSAAIDRGRFPRAAASAKPAATSAAPAKTGYRPRFGETLNESVARQAAAPAASQTPAPVTTVKEPAVEKIRNVVNQPAHQAVHQTDTSPGRAEWDQVLAELKEIRGLIGNTGREQKNGRPGIASEFLPHYERLTGTGVAPETAESLVHEAARLFQSLAITEAGARQALRRVLVGHAKTSGPLLTPADLKKTVMLVGSTGVGKTTTIAKLAARYQLHEHRRVALITLDTYRVAAVEQLRSYANVIGITMDVALTTREALECVRRRSEAELILIDTAGRSPRDSAGIEELKDLLALDHPVELHAVLSAATRQEDLFRSLERYTGIRLSRLLFTKMDETRSFGGLFEVMLRTGLPISYTSAGQQVPDDLDVANPDGLADLLLGAEPAAERTERPNQKEKSERTAPVERETPAPVILSKPRWSVLA